jgi:sugar phosphate isomerase/epimerase
VRLGLALLLGLLGCAGAPPARALPNPFHVFHFCMAQLSPARQAALAREVGYDGLAFQGSGDRRVLDEVAAYQRDRQTPLAALLWGLAYDAPEPFDAALVDALSRALSGTGTILWLTVSSRQPPPFVRDEREDRRAAEAIQRFADIARRHGVVVALYPHDGEYLATAEHALRLIHLADRAGDGDNLKLSLHLCHELRAGHGARLAEVLQATLPWLAVVSISGANNAVTPGSPDWSDAIQVLGEGDYDVQGFLDTLVAAGYTGPLVLHTYGLRGEPRDLLTRSFRAWRTLSANAADAALRSP